MRTRLGIATLTLGLVAGVGVRSSVQTQSAVPDPTPAFEVASVKRNVSTGGFVRILGGGGNGRFEATNVPLRLLIRNAYQLQDFQIVGAPGWIDQLRFDVVAKVPDGVTTLQPGPPPGPMALMLRALLADRFKLVTHNETRELPEYALMLARSDGRLGPNLGAAKADCAAVVGAARGRGAPAAPVQPGDPLPCGMMVGLGNIRGGAMRLDQLATLLAPFVGRTVVNKTGLTDNYDFSLTWTPEQMPAGAPGAGGGPAGPPLVNGQVVDLNGPSIFTAVQEQLGLKLESQRGPVEVLVIDRVEQPTED